MYHFQNGVATESTDTYEFVADNRTWELNISREGRQTKNLLLFCNEKSTLKVAINFELCFWHSVIFSFSKLSTSTVYLKPKHFDTRILIIACSTAAKNYQPIFSNFLHCKAYRACKPLHLGTGPVCLYFHTTSAFLFCQQEFRIRISMRSKSTQFKSKFGRLVEQAAKTLLLTL